MTVSARFIPLGSHPETTPAPRERGEWGFVDDDDKACAPPAAGQEGNLEFACVRNGGRCGAIRVGNGLKPADVGPLNRATWQWNGSTQQPTLTPSINCHKCGWHAFLTDGTWGDG